MKQFTQLPALLISFLMLIPVLSMAQGNEAKEDPGIRNTFSEPSPNLTPANSGEKVNTNQGKLVNDEKKISNYGEISHLKNLEKEKELLREKTKIPVHSDLGIAPLSKEIKARSRERVIFESERDNIKGRTSSFNNSEELRRLKALEGSKEQELQQPQTLVSPTLCVTPLSNEIRSRSGERVISESARDNNKGSSSSFNNSQELRRLKALEGSKEQELQQPQTPVSPALNVIPLSDEIRFRSGERVISESARDNNKGSSSSFNNSQELRRLKVLEGSKEQKLQQNQTPGSPGLSVTPLSDEIRSRSGERVISEGEKNNSKVKTSSFNNSEDIYRLKKEEESKEESLLKGKPDPGSADGSTLQNKINDAKEELVTNYGIKLISILELEIMTPAEQSRILSSPEIYMVSDEDPLKILEEITGASNK